MLTLESFEKQYDTTTSELVIRGRTFRFFMARTLDDFVDQQDIFQDFPLWIKIWEASFLKLLRTFLKEGGEVILAEGIRKTSMAFMQ